jgi:hypothetical protein
MTIINPQALQRALDELNNTANGAARMARQAYDSGAQTRRLLQQIHADNQKLQANMATWKSNMAGMNISSSIGAGAGRPDLLHIEDLPGRRIPFDIVVAIGIEANLTSPVTGTYTLSMDGPFVAVSRYATFMSSYTFQVLVEQQSSRYVGRSWGRQRPISSVLDVMDAMQGDTPIPMQTEDNYTCPGAAPPIAAQVIPNNKSPFRTMEWDGFIELRNQVYPRQSSQVPSSLWAPGWSQMLQLPVLDYYEKGEIVEFMVEPSHVNNPRNGNIQAILGSMPYLESQYDSVEGVSYPVYACESGVDDIIQRQPDGILYIGLLGYKILQPTGVAVR